MYDSPHCGIFDHSAHQPSIYGAVATWCEDLAQLIAGQTHVFMEKIGGEGERPVVSKKWNRKKWILWYRHRGGVNKQRENACVFILKVLKELSSEVQFTKACESAGLMRRVSIGMHNKTIHNVNAGFEGKTGACTEYTKPREVPGPEIIARIGGHTKIGSVLQVKT